MAVLAPADFKRKVARNPQPGQAKGLAGALMGAFKAWDKPDQDDAKLQELAKRTAERATEADRVEAVAIADKAQRLPTDLLAFLRPVGVMEMRFTRMLSSLCALTYDMPALTPDTLFRRHRLKLVTTSLACAFGVRMGEISPLQAMEEGDAMAGEFGSVLAFQEDIQTAAQAAGASPAMKVVAKVEPIACQTPTKNQPVGANPAPPAPVAGLTAASVAASAAGSVASVAKPIASPIASNISAFTSSVTSSTPIQSVASQLQSAASAGHSTAVATVATVSAALESTWSRDRAASRPARECTSPTEWFVADDPDSGVRFFVIQGSDNMDHWRVNLTFDPVPFEDPALGIKVHRGVYETAQILYARFLPLVQEHVAEGGDARVAFSGHSLGGSLATLLMIMYVHRGVLPPSALVPVYTFGAPAILCQGCSGAGCSIPAAAAVDADTGGVLSKFRLPQNAVRNVLMHRDIVPRAFACDYSLVADLLKRVGESFREHKCLSGNRQVMFNVVGKVMVLQPAHDAGFVQGDGYHPLLPARPGLYSLCEPTALGGAAAQVRRDTAAVAGAVHAATEAIAAVTAEAEAALVPAAAVTAPPRSGKTSWRTKAYGRRPDSIAEAVWELMNNPHPLDILADPGAYGDAGSISRYHNPDNYTRALGGVLHARGSGWRRLVSNAKNSPLSMRFFLPTVWPLPATDSASEALPNSAPPPSSATHAGGKARLPSVRPHMLGPA